MILSRNSRLATAEQYAGAHSSSAPLALDAASQGFGTALGRRRSVDSAVTSGSLQEMGGPPIVGTTAYWLVCSELTLERHEAKLFRVWLLNQLGKSSPILVR